MASPPKDTPGSSRIIGGLFSLGSTRIIVPTKRIFVCHTKPSFGSFVTLKERRLVVVVVVVVSLLCPSPFNHPLHFFIPTMSTLSFKSLLALGALIACRGFNSPSGLHILSRDVADRHTKNANDDVGCTIRGTIHGGSKSPILSSLSMQEKSQESSYVTSDDRVKKKLWTKRLWSRLSSSSRKGRTRGSSSTRLNTLTIDQEAFELIEGPSHTILNKRGSLFDTKDDDHKISPASISQEQKPVVNSSVLSLGGAVAVKVLKALISRYATEEPEDLTIRASQDGLFVPRFVMGRFMANAYIETGRLVFPSIRLSSGRLYIQRVALNWLGFLSNKTDASRYRNQFDLFAEDWKFSRHDLLFSDSVRNGLRLLLVRILREKGVDLSSIEISSLDILVS